MSEIDITDFVLNVNTHDLSASVAEMGQNAGKITWANAKSEAQTYQFITEDNRPEFEAWVEGFGAWDEDERKSWSLDECNALLIQFIAGDMNEIEALCSDFEGEIDWDAVEQLGQAGTISSRIYGGSQSIDGRIYFYMGD
jgi:hypothetical protein